MGLFKFEICVDAAGSLEFKFLGCLLESFKLIVIRLFKLVNQSLFSNKNLLDFQILTYDVFIFHLDSHLFKLQILKEQLSLLLCSFASFFHNSLVILEKSVLYNDFSGFNI